MLGNIIIHMLFFFNGWSIGIKCLKIKKEHFLNYTINFCLCVQRVINKITMTLKQRLGMYGGVFATTDW